MCGTSSIEPEGEGVHIRMNTAAYPCLVGRWVGIIRRIEGEGPTTRAPRERALEQRELIPAEVDGVAVCRIDRNNDVVPSLTAREQSRGGETRYGGEGG